MTDQLEHHRHGERAKRCDAGTTEETRRITQRGCMNRTKDPSGRCWRHQ